jgi:hypothetical protein
MLLQQGKGDARQSRVRRRRMACCAHTSFRLDLALTLRHYTADIQPNRPLCRAVLSFLELLLQFTRICRE